MARTFQPLGDRLVIKPTEREDVSVGGIVLPDTVKEKPQEGEIVAAGPGRLTEDGKRIPVELKVGDRVLYAKYAGTEVREAGTDYLVVRESDVLAKIS